MKITKKSRGLLKQRYQLKSTGQKENVEAMIDLQFSFLHLYMLLKF